MLKEPSILWEGLCSYAVKHGSDFDIVVYSSNSAIHTVVHTLADSVRAERVCRRLNAYPRQTRDSFGLL